jgi:hypothetical protein
LLRIHLVWLEIIVHPTSSLVFESDPGDPNLMRQLPRDPRIGLLTRSDWELLEHFDHMKPGFPARHPHSRACRRRCRLVK